MPCAPGPNPHAQSFDYELSGDDGVLCYGEIVWLRDDNSYITQTGTTAFGRKGFDQSGNSRIRHIHTAPSADTAKLQARVVFMVPAGTTATGMRFRQLKVELGNVATPYSGEATAAQSYQAFSDLNSSFASLSSTVASQGGAVTALQQSFTSLNGTVSSLSSTVSAQGTSITSLQSVQATQAGTIATLQQRSTVGGNLLNNTEFAADTSSWNVYIWDQNSAGFEWGRDLPDSNWRPNNEHMLALHQTDSNAGRFSQWYSEQVNVIGGHWYEGSAHTSSHRCYTMLRIDWYDGNGSGITSSDSNLGWSNGYPGFFLSNGGTNLGNWQRLWVKAQAPMNATRAILTMVKTGTSQDGAWAGAADSWAWFARPQLSEVYSDTVMPVAYFPGRTSASFASQQTVINGLSGQYASLSTTVSTQGSSISQNATAISGLQGQQASLSSTVATQGALISVLQAATSTLQGDTATLRTQVTAGSPNLLRNGGFELGNLNYWSQFGTSGFGVNTATGTWGVYAGNGANVPDGTHTYLESNRIDVEANDYYTLTADVGYFIIDGSGICYLEIYFCNSGGAVIGGGPGPSIASGRNFSAYGDTRRDLKTTLFAPSGTTQAFARIVWYKASGTIQSMHVRQVKLERGQVATPYSSEATVRQSFEALSTLDTQYASLSSTVGVLGASVSTNATAISNLQGQYASLSSSVGVLGATVSTNSSAISTLNGNVATLFGRWGVEIDVNGYISGIALNNNGSRSDMVVRADKFAVINPSGGDRTEFYDGRWYIYGGSTMEVRGKPFGSSNQFIEWVGPIQGSLSACTENNALKFTKTNGQGYYRGGIIAGNLVSSVANSSLGTTATITTGNIGSNGSQINVNISYTMQVKSTLNFPATTQGRNDYDAAIAQFGSVNGDGFNEPHTGTKANNVTSGFTMTLSKNGGAVYSDTGCNGALSLFGIRPVIGDAGGYIEYTYDYWKSYTWPDSEISTSVRNYSGSFSRSFGIIATPSSQRISVTSQEWS